MKISFYPLDFEYKLRDGKPYIYLYGKLKKGEQICVLHHYQPYFYAQVQELDKKQLESKLKTLKIESSQNSPTAEVLSWKEVEKELLGKKEQFWQIFVNYPKAVPPISRELESWGINCFEKDILFVQRYLKDLEFTSLSLLEVEGDYLEAPELKVSVFLAEKIKVNNKKDKKDKKELPKLKILALDIETYAKEKIIDFQKNPILMLALYGIDEKGAEYKKVLTWKSFNHSLDYLEIAADEKALLQRAKEIISEFQPDILTGYFSDVFDLPYLQARAEKYNLQLELGLDHSELNIERGSFREGQSRITGIPHLDLLKFIRNVFGPNLKTDSYSLNAVAEELLALQKKEVNLDHLYQEWDNNSDKLADYCEYNLHDAHLTFQLFQKLFSNMVEFARLTNLPLYDVTRMRFSRLVENYILKEAVKCNVLAPNRPGHEEVEQRIEETFTGAFVYEPTPGLYKDIVIFDFRSLYPSIITAHNIGPESFQCECCPETGKVPEKPSYWFCTQHKKFIPTILEQLIVRRGELKEEIKKAKSKKENTSLLEAQSLAIKTLSNSFYGYLGFFGARWYCLECAQATTAYARYYIKKAIKKAEGRGFKVLYGDTDSFFVLLGDKKIADSLQLKEEINQELPGKMELDFQGYYPRGIFVQAKGTEKGAKKRYALISEEGFLKITGFEFVRRNSSLLAKEVQEKVLRSVLTDKKEEAFLYVKEMVKQLNEGKIESKKLIIKTQITKELKSYTSEGPHVAMARKMVEKGFPIVPGTVIEYIICKGSGLIRERAKLPEEVKAGEYDADYYINNQLLPAVMGIFNVLGYKEEDFISGQKQTGLGKFF